ncbi:MULTISPECIES: glucose-6-phosphate isomerase [Acidithiobacillus]|uniref:Glucose-6-phosphate isomerase n=1 Tax=Acidithiobacillus ferridurans TaxID=1232575 RepID=A0A8X8G8W7_ACIFI|nr:MULTISPECIES: glucose-6-phosphate isomerase [Acidithiobacillus]MBU2715247.1 glucose-6-phosphate isomerase [Acidithiobacillus ferridurans]MBU2722593.1 glucose-6-phosphate isomerase [Acidithiobacillus ferridurans]MBU2727464.1 glucose-6-phosphate isomerase [Acidithiobacillus ferridurans]MDA8247380.1 glucose-6-phosphate isomerase [Acidithiobacillus sp.]
MNYPVTELSSWHALANHAPILKKSVLRDLFFDYPERGHWFAAHGAGLYLDYSKNAVNEETIRLLIQLAEERFLPQRRAAMFSGEIVNLSEERAALHTALRAPRDAMILAEGRNVVPGIHAMLDRMREFSEQVRNGTWTGASGKPIRHIVHIGIGGSYLGPEMAYQALRSFRQKGLDVRFVANVDGAAFIEATETIDPAETLFIVCSETFTTPETMANARAARQWIVTALGEQAVSRHFVAMSTNADAIREFGIASEQTFGFWNWVGGRYSMESAIGLSTMIAIGPAHFEQLLQGFRAMDEHFLHAPMEENLPILMGLLSIWNNNFLGADTLAILPYAHELRRLPAYLQQLHMESNGKCVGEHGESLTHQTCPIVWGEPGTDAQHSFYQLLHQGTRQIACDLIGFCEPLSGLAEHHDQLMANLFAQAEALAFGKSAEDLRTEGVSEKTIPHQVCPGNRSSNVILAEALTPYTLGSLVALYEHSVFVQGAIWGVDSFDQWGVQLGKALAQRILPALSANKMNFNLHDSSTQGLLNRYLRHKMSTVESGEER